LDCALPVAGILQLFFEPLAERVTTEQKIIPAKKNCNQSSIQVLLLVKNQNPSSEGEAWYINK